VNLLKESVKQGNKAPGAGMHPWQILESDFIADPGNNKSPKKP
jgi:hypothetical protein